MAQPNRHCVKVGPGPRDLGPQDLGTLGQVELGTPLKFKSRTPGLPSKFKSGTPSPFFNELIFFQNISFFFTYLLLCLF